MFKQSSTIILDIKSVAWIFRPLKCNSVKNTQKNLNGFYTAERVTSNETRNKGTVTVYSSKIEK